MSEEKLPKSIPETSPTATTYRELVGSSYIVLHDGSVARKLKPQYRCDAVYWYLSHDGHLRCVSQKTIDSMTSFP